MQPIVSLSAGWGGYLYTSPFESHGVRSSPFAHVRVYIYIYIYIKKKKYIYIYIYTCVCTREGRGLRVSCTLL